MDGSVVELRTQKRLELSERLERIAELVTDNLPDKIDSASFKDLTIGLGILVEKRQLLRGEPTSNTQVTGDTEETRASRLAELLGHAKERIGEAVERPADEKPEAI